MELTKEENQKFVKEKSRYEGKIKEHEKQKILYMEKGEYDKAKKENEEIDKLKEKVKGVDYKKIELIHDKQNDTLENNYDEIIKEIKSNYTEKIKEAEDSYQKGLKELKNKNKKELKALELNSSSNQKPSVEYSKLELEEKKLLEMNKFDEAIVIQKRRKRQGEIDKEKFNTENKFKLETLKRNLIIKQNKELENYKEKKNNDIELIKKEMETMLENVDQLFNNKKFNLTIFQNNKNLYKTNSSLAKSRENYGKLNKKKNLASIKRIISPINLNKMERIISANSTKCNNFKIKNLKKKKCSIKSKNNKK